MRKDVQEIFRSTPHGKQVMMFSATLSKEIRPICKKFMQDVNYRVPNYDILVTWPQGKAKYAKYEKKNFRGWWKEFEV